MSYGFQSATTGMMDCGKDVLDEVEHNFMLLAARGIAVIVASGDDGSASRNKSGRWIAQSEEEGGGGGGGGGGSSSALSMR